MEKANLRELESFTTLDGSQIRELAGPAWTNARNQSLAEAAVSPGAETAEHYHPRSEELYYSSPAWEGCASAKRSRTSGRAIAW